MSHRILLLNFTQREADAVAKAGFSVERGFIGNYISHMQSFPFQIPHPFYEYDILFYNSEISSEVSKEFTPSRNLTAESGLWRTLSRFDGAPHVRVSFVGRSFGVKSLFPGGVSFIEVAHAEENVSSLQEIPDASAFSIQEVHKLVASFRGQVANVAQFFNVPNNVYPFNHFPVLVTRSGSQVAGYGTVYDKRTLPSYIFLPQLKNQSQAMIQILQCLENVYPELFPDRVKRGWLKTDEFALPEERELQQEIKRITAEAIKNIEAKKAEKEKVERENSFIRELLVATEDGSLDADRRLSYVVRMALEFLEFRVEDIDKKIMTAIKREDFWVIDEDYLAITEVSGTVHKNPKVKEFNDILARIATIYRRRGDLAPPSGADVSGLLILNYDIDTHPTKRPRTYAGEDEDIVETAVDQGIGLLSTVELHRMIVAVKEGRLTKSEARTLIKRPGRIEFEASRAATS